MKLNLTICVLLILHISDVVIRCEPEGEQHTLGQVIPDSGSTQGRMGAKDKEEGGAKDASSHNTWGGGYPWQVVDIKQAPATSKTRGENRENSFVQL